MEYAINIVNPATTPFKYILFQTLEKSKNMVSVVWMTGPVAPQSDTPIPWSSDACITLGTKTDTSYEETNSWPVPLHTCWRLTYDPEQQDIACIQEPRPGSRIPTEIIAKNRTGEELNIGLGMGLDTSCHACVYMDDILSNENVLFDVDPIYHLGIVDPATPVELGQIVSLDETQKDAGLSPADMLACCPVYLTSTSYLAKATLTIDPKTGMTISIAYLTS